MPESPDFGTKTCGKQEVNGRNECKKESKQETSSKIKTQDALWKSIDD